MRENHYIKRFEKIDPEEYKLLMFLRNRRRRMVSSFVPLKFEVIVKNGIVRCRDIIDKQLTSK